MKEKKSVDRELVEMSAPFTLNRREFLKLLSGGIIISFSLENIYGWEEAPQQRRSRREPDDPNAYLIIGEDGTVTCLSGKIEMGQGVITSLPQMLAEELEVPLESVKIVLGDTDLCPYDRGTFGSRSTKFYGPLLRAAAAEAREVLIELAAEQLGLPKDKLYVKEGFVIEKNNPKKKLSYASLTKGKKIERRFGKEAPLKPVSGFSVCGKPRYRTDSHEKVTGEAKFAGDIHLEGMVYARILRPPAHRAQLKSVDTSSAEKMADVQVVRDGDLIAVLHPTPDGAAEALKKIKAQFVIPKEDLDQNNIYDHLLSVASNEEVIEQKGDLEQGKKLVSQLFEETYLNCYVAHAPIETHTALAKVEGNKAVVWASSQTPFRAKDEVAQVLGLPAENVRVIAPFVGGGFGGKTRNGQVVEAARLSKLTGKPVQVAWTRGEEFFFDNYRPASIIKIKSGLDDQNKIVYWHFENFYAGERSSQMYYDVPHYQTVMHGSWGRGGSRIHPFGVGAWRGPGSNTNIYARESHIDVMASKVGMDALEFRLKNLGSDKRMQRVLKAAAEKFGWTPAKSPSGRGYGIACLDYLGTYVALCAHVDVDKKSGKIQARRVVVAQDTGTIINPQGIRIQIEGCVAMGLGYCFTEEIHFKGGKILDTNFDTYEFSRFSWMPKIEVVLVENPDLAPQGCGEPAITGMGAVMANAVYDAIGIRFFELPMTPQRVKSALT
ncbi:MAG: xanthine dehydrogenase family protein molybdopterin-binding subunit [Candidatus Aminicenantes bacterium]|nr:xanthine dehydrogenase family protein molybdopterin-binding subunit [Candidatus Aminicenantes bacterium]